MDNPGTEHSQTGQDARTQQDQHPWWTTVLFTTTALLTAGLFLAPLSLSAQDIMDWANKALGLKNAWPWIVFYALDASAIVSVLIAVYFAHKGRRPGVVQVLVWVVAAISAWAQYKHGLRTKEERPDAWWFFPTMAFMGPIMLEMVLSNYRKIQREKLGQVAKQLPKFGFLRWIPGIGSFIETYGAWRVARLMNLSSYDEAVDMYRTVCPKGGLKVLKAVRAHQDQKTAQQKHTQDLYDNPHQEQPEQKTDTPAAKKRTQDNEKYLEIIRSTWPDEIPSGYKIRKELNVNYNKSKELIEQLEQENKTEENQ